MTEHFEVSSQTQSDTFEDGQNSNIDWSGDHHIRQLPSGSDDDWKLHDDEQFDMRCLNGPDDEWLENAECELVTRLNTNVATVVLEYLGQQEACSGCASFLALMLDRLPSGVTIRICAIDKQTAREHLLLMCKD